MEKFKDNIFSGPKHVRDEPIGIKYEANEGDQLKCAFSNSSQKKSRAAFVPQKMPLQGCSLSETSKPNKKIKNPSKKPIRNCDTCQRLHSGKCSFRFRVRVEQKHEKMSKEEKEKKFNEIGDLLNKVLK